jgi:hypothetical protein
MKKQIKREELIAKLEKDLRKNGTITIEKSMKKYGFCKQYVRVLFSTLVFKNEHYHRTKEGIIFAIIQKDPPKSQKNDIIDLT